MMNQGHYAPVLVATRTNVLGMVGFWLSVAGFFTCGIAGVPGVICSAIAMKHEPKGWAVAGLCVGTPSLLWVLSWTVITVLGAIGSGAHG